MRVSSAVASMARPATFVAAAYAPQGRAVGLGRWKLTSDLGILGSWDLGIGEACGCSGRCPPRSFVEEAAGADDRSALKDLGSSRDDGFRGSVTAVRLVV